MNETSATFELSVPKSQSDLFFQAVAWQIPHRPISPPTLATIFREGEFKMLSLLNIPLHKVLHGEQKYKFLGELSPDQVYRGETRVASHHEKAGMGFYVFQTILIDSEGKPCVECLSTIIHRGQS